jgi:hypothetical protein
MDAAAALSRYQASREAARTLVSGDATAALERSAGAPAGPPGDEAPAGRYDSPVAGESLPRTDHDGSRTADEPEVPGDAGGDRSTRRDAPADRGAAPPAAARSGPGSAAASGGPRGTGENRAMDRDAGVPPGDHPSREHRHEPGAGGER